MARVHSMRVAFVALGRRRVGVRRIPAASTRRRAERLPDVETTLQMAFPAHLRTATLAGFPLHRRGMSERQMAVAVRRRRPGHVRGDREPMTRRPRRPCAVLRDGARHQVAACSSPRRRGRASPPRHVRAERRARRPQGRQDVPAARRAARARRARPVGTAPASSTTRRSRRARRSRPRLRRRRVPRPTRARACSSRATRSAARSARLRRRSRGATSTCRSSTLPPQVGNARLARLAREASNLRMHRVANRRDIVTRAPNLGYRHAGHTLVIDGAPGVAARAYKWHEGLSVLTNWNPLRGSVSDHSMASYIAALRKHAPSATAAPEPWVTAYS